MDRLKSNHNAARVLQQIMQNEGISRIEIAKQLGLDKSTITSIVSSLIQTGIVEETSHGQASSRGGRRPVELKVNANFGCILGIDISYLGYEAIVLNLDGDPIYSEADQCTIDGSSILSKFVEISQAIQAKLQKRGYQLCGIGVGITGIVNYHEGTILHSDLFKIHEPLRFSDLASEKLDIPVYVENDANCCGWSELASKKSPVKDNFLCLFLRHWGNEGSEESKDTHYGLGMGIVLSGKVYHGSNYAAGEFKSIYAQDGTISQFSVPNEELFNIDNSQFIAKIADELARHVAFLVNSLDLSAVVVVDTNDQQEASLKSQISAKIQEQCSSFRNQELLIVSSTMGDQEVAYGAAGMVLVRIFNNLEFSEREKSSQPSGLSILLQN